MNSKQSSSVHCIILVLAVMSCTALSSQTTSAPARSKSAASPAKPAAIVPQSSMNNIEAALNKIIAEEWENQLREDPLLASSIGDKRWNNKLPDASLEAHKRRYEHAQETVKKLEAIDATKLTSMARTNYEMLLRDERERVESYEFHEYCIPV